MHNFAGSTCGSQCEKGYTVNFRDSAKDTGIVTIDHRVPIVQKEGWLLGCHDFDIIEDFWIVGCIDLEKRQNNYKN